MRTRIILSTIAAIALSMASAISASALGWGSMKEFIHTDGACLKLATLAHPSANYISTEVLESDSNTITVKVTYRSFLLGLYSCVYQVERASTGDGNIISQVRCISENRFSTSFSEWSDISDYPEYSDMYDNLYKENPETAIKVWGASKFSELSNTEKAGFVMTLAFVDYVN